MFRFMVCSAALPDQVGRYQRIGFRVAEASRCMIRPTEALEPAFDDRFELLRPGMGHTDALVDLLVAAGKNDAMKGREALVSEKRENVEFFFRTYSELELHMEASVLVLPRESRKPAGEYSSLGSQGEGTEVGLVTHFHAPGRRAAFFLACPPRHCLE